MAFEDDLVRVLVVSHTYIVDLNCQKLRALANLSAEMDVTIVVPRRWRPGGLQNQLVEPPAQEEHHFRVVPVSNFSQNNQGLLTFGGDLIPLLRRVRPHIIQVEQGVKSLAYAETITLNRLLGLQAKNLCFTWWNLPYNLKFPAAWIERYNLNNTDGLIAGNQDGADILRQRGYRGPLRVMPQLGVAAERFRPESQGALANQLGFHPDTFILGFVGRFVAEKGLITLCDALVQLRDHPHWRWLLLGRGPLKQHLMAKAKAGGIADRLCWVDSVPHDQVPRYINLLDALVLPSETTQQFKTMTSAGWKEQFGHVLIEAMACRVPVIGSDSGEIPNVINKAGLIFPAGNPDALATSIRTLMEWPNRREQFAEMGYQRAMEHFTNHALAKRMLAFYEELIES